MNERMGKTNHYIYKWTPEMAEKLEKSSKPGDRFSVSIRDFDDPEHRASFAALRKKGRECYCVLPVLWRPGQGPDPEEIVEEVDGFYAGNLGQIRRLLDTEKPVMGDVGLNVFNRETALLLERSGLCGATVSYELEREEWENCLPLSGTASGGATSPRRGEAGREEDRNDPGSPQRREEDRSDLGSPLWGELSAKQTERGERGPFETEILRSGRVPAMISEYCPLAGAEGIRGSGCGKCRDENPVWLKDFKGERYPVLLEPRGCTALILSRKPLDRPWADELAAERDDVIRRICIFE